MDATRAMPVLTLDPGPLARLEAVKRDSDAPSVIFQRLTSVPPESLADIAAAWELPRGRFVEWFTTEHAALYESALRVRAGELADEALEIADAADPKAVKVSQLRVRTRLELAGYYDRARFGAKENTLNVNVGEFTMLPTERLVETLDRIVERGQAKRAPVTIEGEK